MNLRTLLPIASLAAGLMLLGAACGGSSDDRSSGNATLEDAKALATAIQEQTKAQSAPVATPASALAGVTASAQAQAQPPARAAQEPATGGGCEIKVGGDQSKTLNGHGSVGTDYWFTDDELRTRLRAATKLIEPTASAAEIERQVEQDMKDEPRLLTLILECAAGSGAEEVSVSLMAPGAKYADVPFGPKRYVIPIGSLLGGGDGEIGALVSYGDGVYVIAEPGELNITKFDRSGIAGTFKLKLKETIVRGPSPTVTLDGTFNLPCTGSAKCQR